MEMLIDPCRPFYALKTLHNAKSDVELTQMLFWSQVWRLATNAILREAISNYIPKAVRDLIDDISQPKFAECLDYISYKEFVFFRQQRDLNTINFCELQELKATSANEKTLFVADPLLWKQIACNIELTFPYTHDYEFSYISQELLNNAIVEDEYKNILLRRHVENAAIPMLCNMPKLLRKTITDASIIPLLKLSSPSNNVCVEFSDIAKMGDLQQQGFTNICFIGNNLSLRLNKHKIAEFSTAELWTNGTLGSKLMMQLSGGTSYLELSKEDVIKLGIHSSDLASNAMNYWMLKSGISSYEIWYNENFNTILQRVKDNYPAINISDITIQNPEYDQSDCIISVSTDKKRSKFDNVIKRVNHSSFYRSMYWLYQLGVLSQIECEMAKVLVINRSDEIEAISQYARSLGYYVPNIDVSLARRIELLIEHNSSTKSLLVISEQEFLELNSLKIENPLCYVWDNLNIDALQKMWKGVFDTDQQHSDTTLSYIQNAWPIFLYYFQLIHDANQDSKLYLIDPLMEDYPEIDKLLHIGSRKINIWQNEQEYDEALIVAQTFFPKEIAKDVEFDIEEALKITSNIFLSITVR